MTPIKFIISIDLDAKRGVGVKSKSPAEVSSVIITGMTIIETRKE
jgi:hypothetical protein